MGRSSQAGRRMSSHMQRAWRSPPRPARDGSRMPPGTRSRASSPSWWRRERRSTRCGRLAAASRTPISRSSGSQRNERGAGKLAGRRGDGDRVRGEGEHPAQGADGRTHPHCRLPRALRNRCPFRLPRFAGLRRIRGDQREGVHWRDAAWAGDVRDALPGGGGGVFLTLGVVRGDAETGLLQPLVVRPLGRTTMLLARFAGAGALAAAYGLIVYLCAVVITGAIGGWWPDHVLTPGLGLAAGLVIVAALSLLGSVFLSSTAQGIAILMVFGAGLTAVLLGQIGEAIDSGSLQDIAKTASWLLPFEALYQGGLHALASNTTGLTGEAISLGPFGGPQGAGVGLVVWAGVYLAGTLAIACLWFARRDL